MTDAGLTRELAVDLASLRPAALIGLPARPLEAGSLANLVLFDLLEGSEPGIVRELRIRGTIHQGELVFGTAE
jgi:dihydroorotase-like cyclic amidohydrolase